MSVSPLSASVVAAIEDLELAARVVVEGMRAGGHRSPFHGVSAEFQQHRPYRAGDDLKHLDWKLLARTDRLYTRQFREATNMSALLILDTSGSMAFPETGVSRFRYSQVVAAALAHLIVTAGDTVGLLALREEGMDYLPARSGRTHLRVLTARIGSFEPSGEWSPADAISRGGELLRRRGLVVVISDFYDQEEETRAALRRVARRGHDVAMIQLTSREETEFPFQGELEFEDLETGRRRRIHATAAGDAVRSSVAAFHRRSRDEALRDGIDHVLMATDEPPSTALRRFLLRRQARRGSVAGARASSGAGSRSPGGVGGGAGGGARGGPRGS